jgi:hypothetical protein
MDEMKLCKKLPGQADNKKTITIRNKLINIIKIYFSISSQAPLPYKNSGKGNPILEHLNKTVLKKQKSQTPRGCLAFLGDNGQSPFSHYSFGSFQIGLERSSSVNLALS